MYPYGQMSSRWNSYEQTTLFFVCKQELLQLLWYKKIVYTTPRKTNMSPENQWSEDVFPIEIVPF